MLHALQRSAGNAAVARAVQRFSEPPKPAGITPKADPKFLAVKAQIAGKSKALKAHPSPKTEAKKAADAAVAPGNDKEAQAKAAQAETMSGAKPAGFDKAGFIAAVKAAIAAQAPKNLDEAAKFSESGKADAVKGQVAGKVAEGKQNSAKDIADKTAAAPDTSKAVDKPVTPLAAESPPAPTPIDAAAGMPSKAPAEQIDFSGGKKETDQQMAEAEVSEEQLANSNEPEFAGALAAKKEGEQHSATAPVAVRESEAATLNNAKAGAASAGKTGLAGMLQAKGSSLSKAATGKAASKAKDEAARAEITSQIKGIFDTAKKDVDAILGGLDDAVAKKFDAGEKLARDAFTADHKARMERYKDDRYSGLLGKGRWLRDKFAGLPDEANQIYLEAKKLYESKMEQVISGVADFIGGELTKAKDRIALGRTQIKDFVAKQPKDLQKVANETSEHFAAHFDQLESDVDSKQDSLAEDLANKYVESRNAVDEEIKAAQEENKGLWDKVKDAVGGAIKTILKLKDMLLGVLARAASAIGKIIKDPIGFLGNLVSAVKNGVMNFAANIVDHLKKGLQAWLLGSLAEAGIELPEKFDLKGIIKLVLSLLGLTWANIRSRIVKVIPESVMDKVEKGVAFIQMVVTEGIGGLWKWVAEKLTDLKEMVMGQIQDFVITKIIKAGITWIISLLNPAAAFIKACKMIYDVVMFFVEKAEQIKEFVDSILDSVESIASGGVGAVAGYIEKTLAKTLPIVLGFLASLLGLGGISDKIKSILQTIQKPVMSVVDKLVAGAVKYGKKLIKGAKKLGKKVLGKVRGGDDSPAGKQQRLDKAMAAAQAATARLAGRRVGDAVLRRLLGVIKLRYGLQELSPVKQGRAWAVQGAINPRSIVTTGVLVMDDENLAAAEFARLANEVESEFFSSGSGSGALLVRGPLEQSIAGSVSRRGAPAMGTAAAAPAEMQGVSSAEAIRARIAVTQQHQQAGNAGLPRFAVASFDVGGTAPLTEMLNPTRGQPFNTRLNEVGAYGLPTAATSSGAIMGVVNTLRANGMSDAQISRVMEHISRTGTTPTPAFLIENGFTGSPTAGVRSGRSNLPTSVALRAVTQLTHIIEPLRFLRRGGGLPQQPIATTTAMAHGLVQGGAANLNELLSENAPLGPATHMRLGNTGRLRSETIGSSHVRLTMLVEAVRRRWSEWVTSTRQSIVDEARRSGIHNPHLVPSREMIKAMLTRFFGDESGRR